MKTQEIINKLSKIDDAEKLLDFTKEFQEVGLQVGFNFETKTAFVKRDFIADIRNKMIEENISKIALAKAIGYDYNNLCKGLHGQRTIPVEYLERIFGLLNI